MVAENDPFAAVRAAGTSAPNFEMDNAAIIARLTQWRSLCSFEVTGAESDTVDIVFKTLPKDVDAFIRDMYDFCPDLVDQGTGCVHEMIEVMEESGEPLSPELEKLIQGIDFSDENYGLEILKREIVQKMEVSLWWD